MGDIENKKLYNHYKSLIAGSYKSGNSVQDQLIISDAKKHLANLIDKNPNLIVEEKPVEQVSDQPKPKRKK